MSTRLFAGLVLATASASVAQVDSILDLPPFAPYSLQSLPQNLVGMSIEEDRWPDWTGNYTSPNSFTMQLLQNLKDRTGVAIPVRCVTSLLHSPILNLSALVETRKIIHSTYHLSASRRTFISQWSRMLQINCFPKRPNSPLVSMIIVHTSC